MLKKTYIPVILLCIVLFASIYISANKDLGASPALGNKSDNNITTKGEIIIWETLTGSILAGTY